VGIFVVLQPLSIALVGVVFLLVVVLTRYISLGSVLAAIALPLVIWLLHLLRPTVGLEPLIFASVASAGLIVLAHRANISRLLAGNESKFK
jgi:glycerol-3-phosphate acyltransferase PlsY